MQYDLQHISTAVHLEIIWNLCISQDALTDAGFLCVFDDFLDGTVSFQSLRCGLVRFEFTHASAMFSLVKVVESSPRMTNSCIHDLYAVFPNLVHIYIYIHS